MNILLRILGIAGLVTANTPAIGHAQLPAQALALQVYGLYSALERGDTALLRSMLTEDLIWTVGVSGGQISKPELLTAAARSQMPAPTYRVDSLQVRLLGPGAAVSEYVRTDTRTIGNTPFITRWRALDIFVASAAQWQLARHTQVWLVTPVTGTVVDSAALQLFVGHYQIAPGYVDDVHWEAGHLVATASGQSVGAQLVPVSLDAFSPDGVGSLIVFERDASGRVLDYVQGYPDGRIIRAMRLP